MGKMELAPFDDSLDPSGKGQECQGGLAGTGFMGGV